MKGYQLVFSTLQNRQHSNGENLIEWLEKSAQSLGIQGITVMNTSKGIGRDGKWHSASFFELAEQPIELIMNVTQAQCEALFSFLQEQNQQIFYTKCAIEFGTI
jgi:PII-like signaling protein